MKGKILCGLLLILINPLVSGTSLEGIVGIVHASALLAGEKPIVSQFRNPRPELLPRNDFVRRYVEETFRDLAPNVMVETLHVYTKPPHANKYALSDREEAALYNSVLALSTLEGLQYFSASRGVMRTFYEISTVVDGTSTRNALPDPVFTQPQRNLTLYARQKDLTFGDNTYQYDFYSSQGAIVFIQQNLTPLRAGIIPAISRNNLRSVVAVLDAGNHILVYAASMARAVSLPGMNERVGESFANRAEAVLNWFSAQADGVFLQMRN